MADVVYTFSESGAQAVERAFQGIGDAAEASAKRSESAFKRTTRAGRSAGRQRARAAGKSAADAGKAEVDAAKRAARERERAEAKASRTIARRRLANIRRIQRERAKATRQQERAEAAAERRSQRRRQRARRAVGGFIGGGARTALRGATRLGAAGLGIAGAATAHAVSNQDKALQLAIKGGRGAGGGLKTDPGAITSRVSDITSNVRGAKSSDLLDAIGAFVSKTGDLPQALAFAEEFAKVSVATGTELRDVGGAAADLMEKFDIQSVDDMADSLAVLAVQGKRGAFELSDAAAQFPKIAAKAALFGLEGKKGLATVGGITQITRRATGSPEQAATAVEGLFAALTAKSGVVKKEAGIDVFQDPNAVGKNRRAREITDLLPEIIAGVGGDLTKLGKIFPKRALSAVAPLIKVFNDAAIEAQTSGKTEREQRAAGEAAVRAELKKAIDSTGARAEIEKDAARAQMAASAQITAAWESIVSNLGNEFAPAVAEAAADLASFVDNADFSGVISAFRQLGRATKFVAERFGIFEKTPSKQLDKTQAQLNQLQSSLSPAEREAVRQVEAQKALPPALRKSQEQIIAGISAGPLSGSLDSSKIRKFAELNAKEQQLRGMAPEAATATEDLTPEEFKKRFVEEGLKAGGNERILRNQADAFATQAISGDQEKQAQARAGLVGGMALPAILADPQQQLIEKLIQSQESRRAGTTEGRLFTEADATGDQKVAEVGVGSLAKSIEQAAERINTATAGLNTATAYHDPP